ncbi:hypothetical protein BEWA_015590 [Theileria equi strain WA]|uniref:Uncharacterized protein n=1 Tax=Theileria equi strain WA TaxID=1537102 RepID=L1LCV0_THEEQ|nr:hypothetical protein BEWA_015590 [Theileria equi strain WA]EKX72998.1 hypothetical protein BEWA_015590 [Theileria equi strain WA]|eukprot:XP_004832450.1 hypothetical protein BEWA_015590 [Theileria equi strain WA]
MTKDQGVTIELSRSKEADKGEITYIDDTGNQNIKVTRKEEPSGSGFLKYIHQASGDGENFILKEVQDDKKNNVIEDSSIDQVTSVSSYYWRHENGNGQTPSKVLLVGVSTNDKGTIYYARNGSGTDWIEQSQLQDGEQLERELDNLNCQHNNAVTMDLYFITSRNLTDNLSSPGENKYCCYEHGGNIEYGSLGDNKIYVERQEVHCKQQTHRTSTTLTAYYKHSIEAGSTLAKIKYKDSKGDRKRIKLSDHPFPIKGPASVSAFYCTGNEPVLIYVEGGDVPINKWYKRNGNYGEWVEVSSHLKKNITPKDLSESTECANWNVLVDALREASCRNYSKCTDIKSLGSFQGTTDIPERLSGEAGLPGAATGRNIRVGITPIPTEAGEYTAITTSGLSIVTVHESGHVSGILGSSVSDTVVNENEVKASERSVKAHTEHPKAETKTPDFKSDPLEVQEDNKQDVAPKGPHAPAGGTGVQKGTDSYKKDIHSDKDGVVEVLLKTLVNLGITGPALTGLYTIDTALELAGKVVDPKLFAVLSLGEGTPRSKSDIPIGPTGEAGPSPPGADNTATDRGDGIQPPDKVAEGPQKQVQEPPKSVAEDKPTFQKIIDPATPIGLGVIVSSVFGGSGAAGFLGYKGYKFYQRFKGDPWVRQI